jgi:16S rRNA processing protein RimM
MPAAEPLAGMELRIPLEERPAPPEGEYYQSDFIGCEVVERDGTRVGEVVGFQEYGGPGLLVVKGAAGELLVPLVKTICVVIDVVARRIVVELPEGFKDLASA